MIFTRTTYTSSSLRGGHNYAENRKAWRTKNAENRHPWRTIRPKIDPWRTYAQFKKLNGSPAWSEISDRSGTASVPCVCRSRFTASADFISQLLHSRLRHVTGPPAVISAQNAWTSLSHVPCPFPPFSAQNSWDWPLEVEI